MSARSLRETIVDLRSQVEDEASKHRYYEREAAEDQQYRVAEERRIKAQVFEEFVTVLDRVLCERPEDQDVAGLTVTVSVADLAAVLNKVDYRSDRSLADPVDRMGDALAIVKMRADIDANKGPARVDEDQQPEGKKCNACRRNDTVNGVCTACGSDELAAADRNVQAYREDRDRIAAAKQRADDEVTSLLSAMVAVDEMWGDPDEARRLLRKALEDAGRRFPEPPEEVGA